MTGCSRLRVLHLTSSFPLSRSSISGIFIYRLINHFPSATKITVLVPDAKIPVDAPKGPFHLLTFRYAPKKMQVLAHEPGGLPAALRRSKWSVLLLPSFFVGMFFCVIRQAMRHDIIHAHWTINGVVAGFSGLLTKTPVITTLRGEDVSRCLSSPVHRFLLALCLRLSKTVITVSSSMYDNIRNWFPEHADKIIFVPNGVSQKLFSVPLRHNISNPTILVLGSLIPVKGVDLTIQALSQSSTSIKWKLVIAGVGPEEDRLKRLTNKVGLAEQTLFIGQINPKEVPALFADSDILVQASYREGRPNSVLEAMAAGKSVVGSEIDGISELIDHGKNGLLFPAGDTDRLTSCLDRLLDSPELREELGQSARQSLIEKKLSWPACAASYMQIYQNLAKGGI